MLLAAFYDRYQHNLKLDLAIILIAIFNFICSYSEEPLIYDNYIVSKVYMHVPNREDYEQILDVANWILNNCEVENEAYIIPHGGTYTPDVFRNASFENIEKMRYLVPYGSAVVGTHKFPEGLLSAKYIINCTPFDSGCVHGIAEKYNNAFLHMLNQEIFEPINTFDMGNEHTIIVYQRIKVITDQEIAYYEESFFEENEQYPEMFEAVWDAYKSNK